MINPATEEIIGKVSKAAPSDVEKALKSAERGFEVWKKISPWQVRNSNGKYIETFSKILPIDIIEKNILRDNDEQKFNKELKKSDLPERFFDVISFEAHFRIFLTIFRIQDFRLH